MSKIVQICDTFVDWELFELAAWSVDKDEEGRQVYRMRLSTGVCVDFKYSDVSKVMADLRNLLK